jgi:hypothetical protein
LYRRRYGEYRFPEMLLKNFCRLTACGEDHAPEGQVLDIVTNSILLIFFGLVSPVRQ